MDVHLRVPLQIQRNLEEWLVDLDCMGHNPALVLVETYRNIFLRQQTNLHDIKTMKTSGKKIIEIKIILPKKRLIRP